MGGDRRYGTANNIRLASKVPGMCHYLYADTPEHRADKLFIRSEVPVHFGRKEMQRPGSGYVLVFCRFGKRHESRFLECMADLERAMLLEGHADYTAFCDEFLSELAGSREGEME